jgi:hypothetical protein
MAAQRGKRDTKEVDRLSYIKAGNPTLPSLPTCKTCKARISGNGMCPCEVSGHPDLKNYKITKDTKVRYSDEESTNSSLNILDITNKAANAALGGTLRIETGDSNAAQQMGISQSENETETKRFSTL